VLEMQSTWLTTLPMERGKKMGLAFVYRP
jgi:hypothetical protein